jgi:hypothetical protein
MTVWAMAWRHSVFNLHSDVLLSFNEHRGLLHILEVQNSEISAQRLRLLWLRISFSLSRKMAVCRVFILSDRYRLIFFCRLIVSNSADCQNLRWHSGRRRHNDICQIKYWPYSTFTLDCFLLHPFRLLTDPLIIWHYAVGAIETVFKWVENKCKYQFVLSLSRRC